LKTKNNITYNIELGNSENLTNSKPFKGSSVKKLKSSDKE